MNSGLEADNQQTYHIGQNDVLLYLLDTSGGLLAEKLIGGLKVDKPVSAMHFKQGFAVIGCAISHTFAEGVNENTNHTTINRQDIFLSVINDFPLSTRILKSGAANALRVFPNPAMERVKIALPAKNSSGDIDIVDATGKVVYKRSIRYGGEIDINVAGWAKGAYVVNWRSANGVGSSVKLLIH